MNFKIVYQSSDSFLIFFKIFMKVPDKSDLDKDDQVVCHSCHEECNQNCRNPNGITDLDCERANPLERRCKHFLLETIDGTTTDSTGATIPNVVSNQCVPECPSGTYVKHS